jgi:type VI secretion system protein ImpF
MVYAPVADADRKNRLSPPLMFVFRATHKLDARSPGNVNRQLLGSNEDAGVALIRSGKPQRVAIAERALQNEVADDMDSLLAHVSFDSSVSLENFSFVQKSILNFGFPDIANRSIDELERSDLDEEIAEILRLYEPRLIASTLRVARDTTIDKAVLQVRYIVRSDLSCRPLDLPVEFIADVDVTTGKIHIGGAKS